MRKPQNKHGPPGKRGNFTRRLQGRQEAHKNRDFRTPEIIRLLSGKPGTGQALPCFPHAGGGTRKQRLKRLCHTYGKPSPEVV